MTSMAACLFTSSTVQSFYYFKVNDTDIQLNAKDILSGFQHFKASIKIER